MSSLFPHYAIRAEGVSFSDMLIPSYTINDQSFTQEEMTAMLQQLSAVVAPYWEDALAISAQIQGAVNEDGSATSVITTKNVAALWSAWSTRLSSDAAMQGILQSVLELVNEGQPEQLTLPELMQSVQSAVDELNAQEENVMCAVTVYEDEAAGSQHIIINAMDSLQLQLSSYVNENNHACMDITLMTNSSESGEAESWEDIYNAITSGENTEDLLLGVTIEITDSETVDAQLYAYVDGEKWQLAFGVTGATEQFNGFAYLSLDPGMGLDDGLVTLNVVSLDLGEPLDIAAPSLEGLTVLDASTMGEDEANLLLADLQNYGLATLITNAQTAMPEQVALLLTLLTSAQE